MKNKEELWTYREFVLKISIIDKLINIKCTINYIYKFIILIKLLFVTICIVDSN